jgi:hypothetical protein
MNGRSGEDAIHPAVKQTYRLLKARKGPATDDDRPRRKSQPPQVIPGQLDLDGNAHGLEDEDIRP